MAASTSQVIRYRRRDLAEEAQISIPTVDRWLIPTALKAGVLRKHGRFWYARAGALAEFLTGAAR